MADIRLVQKRIIKDKGLLKEGEDYYFLDNRQAISIVITDFNLFDDDRFYRCGKFCDTETGEVLTNISRPPNPLGVFCCRWRGGLSEGHRSNS
ncbi:MAG: hypothetical protein LBD17_05655 [Endomicrobium sp.]|nr:hypothetical protein [Endomicrobium sp.]